MLTQQTNLAIEEGPSIIRCIYDNLTKNSLQTQGNKKHPKPVIKGNKHKSNSTYNNNNNNNNIPLNYLEYYKNIFA